MLARDFWKHFATKVLPYPIRPSDMCNLVQLYVHLNREIPTDVEEAIMRPGSSLRCIAFDALVSSTNADDLPQTLRAEYWRRH